jgi:microcystin-dependent protein
VPFDIQASIDSGINNPAVLLYLSGISLQIALDALNTYIEPSTWYPEPTDIDAAQNYIDTAANELMGTSMISTGMIMPYAAQQSVSPPAGWLYCNGAEVPQSAYPDLYAICGTHYGAATSGYFKLPDLRTRIPRGADTADTVGASGGADSVTLSINELPAHQHKIDRGLTSVTAGPVPVVTASGIYTQGNTTSVGGGQAFSIRNKYINLQYIIKT